MLVNLTQILSIAEENRYAVGAFNTPNLECINAVLSAAEKLNVPVIIAHAELHEAVSPLTKIGPVMVQAAKASRVPVCVHLDHCEDLDYMAQALEIGFTGVMYDGSTLPYEENLVNTKKAVAMAGKYGCGVEAELGVLGGVEDEVAAEESKYTKPEEVVDFTSKTGCDSLAISIGTSHGRCKFTPEQCTRREDGTLVPPPLAFDVLEAIEKQLPGFPIVLHGSSSVPQIYVAEIEKYGGKIPNSVGIPEEQLRKAAKSAVCKINVDSDGRLAMTAAIRKHLVEHPEDFDPRQYLTDARAELVKMYADKNKNVFGSAGHALD